MLTAYEGLLTMRMSCRHAFLLQQEPDIADTSGGTIPVCCDSRPKRTFSAAFQPRASQWLCAQGAGFIKLRDAAVATHLESGVAVVTAISRWQQSYRVSGPPSVQRMWGLEGDCVREVRRTEYSVPGAGGSLRFGNGM